MTRFASWYLAVICLAAAATTMLVTSQVAQHTAVIDTRNAQLTSDLFDARAKLLQIQRANECNRDPVSCFEMYQR